MNDANDLRPKLAGKFLVVDGPDGCGKSTQLKWLADHLQRIGLNVTRTRDPGGTAIGDHVRAVVLGDDLRKMNVRCETFLFMASRAQLVAEVIDPLLAAGGCVLCDRFISATFAYQGAAGYDVGRLRDLGALAVGETWPHLTIVFDVPIEAAFARKGWTQAPTPGAKPTAAQDAMEARGFAFHKRVRELFLALPKSYPRPVHILDGSGTPQSVHERVLELLHRVDL